MQAANVIDARLELREAYTWLVGKRGVTNAWDWLRHVLPTPLAREYARVHFAPSNIPYIDDLDLETCERLIGLIEASKADDCVVMLSKEEPWPSF